VNDFQFIRLVLDILKTFDGQCANEEQQQVIYELKEYVLKVKRSDFQCWSCTQHVSKLMGLSLDNSGEYHVCQKCWNHINVYHRLLAKKWFIDNPTPRNDSAEELLRMVLRPKNN